MNGKKIIPLILAIQLLSQIALCAEETSKEKIPKDKPGTAVFVMTNEQSKIIEVTGVIIKEELEGLEIDMKIPVISNLNNRIFQKRINQKIKKKYLALKKSIEKDAVENHQYAKNQGFPVIPYTLMTNYHIKANGEIFSLETTIYDYRGGAHGLTTTEYYNIDTKKSKLLNIEDLFKESSNYKEILNQEINKQIQQRTLQGEVFFEDQGGFKGIKDKQSFYIDHQGNLVVVFGLYEIAPYASGIVEFHIPKEVIKSIEAYD